MDFTVEFELLTKDDMFCLKKTICEETFHDALDKAKQIAFSEFSDNIIALKVFNDKHMMSINF